MSDQQYSHRNGETEPPTTAGEFWFDGAGIASSHVYKWRDRFSVERHNGVLCVFDDDGYPLLPVTSMAGRWWGPIMPPWEQQP